MPRQKKVAADTATTATGDDLGLASSAFQNTTAAPGRQVPSSDTNGQLVDIPFAIVDAGDLRHWRIELPNIIDDLGLDPYEFRLYAHLKRVAGGSVNGACWESTRTLAERCRMSMGKVSAAKQALIDMGLILVDREVHYNDQGRAVNVWQGNTVDYMTIVDIWPRNFAHYASLKAAKDQATAQAQGCSCGEHPCSPHEHGCSPGERKNQPSEESTYGKKKPSSSAGVEPAQGDDPGQRQVVQTADDDVNPLGSGDDVPEVPEAEGTDGQNVDQADTSFVSLTPGEDVGPLDERDAALALLRQVAPDFDQDELYIDSVDDVAKVGLVCASLVADPGKLRRLNNPAGYVRKTARNGFRADDRTLAIWRQTLAGAGDDPLGDPVNGLIIDHDDMTWRQGDDDQIVWTPAPVDPATAIWRKALGVLTFSGAYAYVDRLHPVAFDETTRTLTLGAHDQTVVDFCRLRHDKTIRQALGDIAVAWDGSAASSFWQTTTQQDEASVQDVAVVQVVADIPLDPATATWRRALEDLRGPMITMDFDLVSSLHPVAFDGATLTLEVPDDWTLTEVQRPRIDDKVRQALGDVVVAYVVPEPITPIGV